MFALSPFAFPSISVPTGGDMELIYSTTLTGSASSIATGTLATGYKSLIVDTSFRCDGSLTSAVVLGYLNGDQTKTNYQVTRFVHYTSTITGSVDYPYMAGTTGANASANNFSMDRIVITDHESTSKYTNWHTVETIMIGTGAGDRFGVISCGQWKNTNAVTSITFEVDSSGPPSFVAGSSVFVYGIK